MSYVVQCKGCRAIIPAPVEILPTQSIAAHCPRCDGYWQYIPTQIFWEQAPHVFDKEACSHRRWTHGIAANTG
jgi:hypothetical protein